MPLSTITPSPAPLQLSTAVSPAPTPGLSPSASPSRSRASSRASHLTLDLSCVSPILPSPPTNTLLITNLNDPTIFSQPHITKLRDLINSTAPLASWSPLKSFRRIVCSFATIEDAISVRQAMDGEAIMGDRVRVYFGEHTPLQPVDQHLQAPEAKKLFFISPPPSPPHGWESKNENPPNAVVVAEDLAHALAKLSWEPRREDITPVVGEKTDAPTGAIGRSRSASILLFEPEDDSKEDMPAISVDDYTDSGDERSPVSPVMIIPEKGSIHTSRPPVELIHGA